MEDVTVEAGEVVRRPRSGPRTWVVLLVTVVAIAVLGGAAFGVSVWMDSRDDEGEAVPATTADEAIDVEPIGGNSANRLFARRTEAGVEIRVHETDDPMFGGEFGARPDAPEWCESESMASATAVSADAVAQTQMPLAKVLPPAAAVTPLIGGQIEGAPIYGVLVQAGPEVTMARLSIVGGGQDSMEPIDGVAALAVAVASAAEEPGDAGAVGGTDLGRDVPMGDPWSDGLRLIGVELLHADGSTERITGDALMQGRNGPPMWTDPECTGEQMFIDEEPPPPPTTVPITLPPPGGTGPADPAAARAEIERVYDELVAGIADYATLARTMDDPSGIDLRVAAARPSDRGQIDRTTVEITDLVFFSPVEASFIYSSTVLPDEEPLAYGRARLIEGTWRITRSTVCQNLSSAGVECGV